MTLLNDMWRNRKYHVKLHYKKFKTNEERLANTHLRIHPDQWVTLVNYWSRLEAERKVNKEAADDFSFWQATGKRKDGSYSASDKEKYEMVNQKLQELPPEEQDTVKGRNKAFRTVMGESNIGRTRLKGSACPSATVFRAHSQACESMESKMDVLLVQMEERERQFKLDMDKRENQIIDNIRGMFQSAGAIFPTPPNTPSQVHIPTERSSIQSTTAQSRDDVIISRLDSNDEISRGSQNDVW